MCDTRSLLCILSMLGPIIGGLSLLVAALVAWRTFVVVQKRTADITWIDSFHDLYSEFWKDEKIAKVRMWIVSDKEYAKIVGVLEDRLRTENNVFGPDENEVLESIDQFCALLTKLQHFSSLEVSRRHVDPWKDVYAHFWIEKIKERKALVRYMDRFWRRLELKPKGSAIDPPAPIESTNPTAGIVTK